MSPTTTSVVIPAFNDEERATETLVRIGDFFLDRGETPQIVFREVLALRFGRRKALAE